MPIKLGASHVVALLLALPVVGEDAGAVHVVVVGVEDLKAVADLAVDVAVRLVPDAIQIAWRQSFYLAKMQLL